MKLNLPKLFLDPEATIAKITELRERVAILHRLVGPELRKFIDTHNLPFSTMNAVLKYGEQLTKSVAILKETVVKLHELIGIDDSAKTLAACPNGQSC